MIRQSQSVRQSQTLQQRLSPQQIQYIKLLQLPTLQLEQRVKQEIESNPVLEFEDDLSSDADDEKEFADDEKELAEAGDLEDTDPALSDDAGDPAEEAVKGENTGEDAEWKETGQAGEQSEEQAEEQASIDDRKEVDWDAYFQDEDTEYVPPYRGDQEEWKDTPKPYKSGIMENMEQQVELLDLDERQKKVAAEIIGSVDSDGYLRRDLDSIIDSVAFSEGMMVTREEAEDVLHQVQRLDPPGFAARNLRECLMVQLELMDSQRAGKHLAIRILDEAWPYFKKKHYDKILRKLNITEEQLKQAYQVIMLLDPKPGESDEYLNADQFIVPDFEVYYEETGNDPERGTGDFVIRLHHRNTPNIRISRQYREMWESLEKNKGVNGGDDTRQFIRDKMESARWFIDSIQQRKQTLMSVMQTIVALQEEFFRTGKGIRPMILKDVAERIGMDISTVSRVVNGKYVQTPFGVYELKYFFTEGVETDSGESISNREIKNILLDLVSKEDKMDPLSDQALADELSKKGYPVARRTISKYREQLNIPVARMRKAIG
ncbi:MAG: RNA polymerase factor sigma-54 [Cyclonatronaceae bacterium]